MAEAILSDKQAASIAEALDGPAPVAVWHGAVRSGKTFSSQVAWAQLCAVGPRGPALMVGKTQDTLERNVIEPLQAMMPDKAVMHTRGANTARVLGRLVYLVGASDVTAETRIRGLTLALAYVDEASLLPRGFWPMLRTRLSLPGAKLLATTNPDNPSHWLHREVLQRAGELGFVHWSFRLDDNPSLTPAFRAQLAAELTGLFYRRFVLGEWVAAEGAVYDMLDLDGRHRVEWAQVPRITEFLLGMDYGTTNPTHAVLLGVGEDNRLYVVAEWRYDARAAQRQLTDAEQETRLAAWLLSGAGVPEDKTAWPRRAAHRSAPPGPQPVHPARIGVDPVAASFRAQLASAGWTNVARPDQGRVIDGIRAVSSLLGAGRLCFVGGAAPELEREMLGYVWDEAAANAGRDEPVKEDDHGCFTAGTSVTTAAGPRPIEVVRPGELVVTRDGWRPVVDAARTDLLARVLTVVTEDGTTLTGTPDHPVWVVGRGWVRLDSLRYVDRMWKCTREPLTIRRADAGKLPAARSRTAMRSIIATAIRTTTRSTTWCASRSLSTSMSTARKVWRAAMRIRRVPWLANVPPSGTPATWGGLGTVSTAGPPGQAGSQSYGNVGGAAGATRHSPGTAASGSAPTPVGQPPVGPVVSTTRTGPVRSAAPASASTAIRGAALAPVRVVAVYAEPERRPVYNLTVAGRHEFFANGLLVSNCDALRYAIVAGRHVWRYWLNTHDTDDEEA